MESGLSNAVRKAIRTAAQLVASGGLTALVALIADGLEPTTAALVLAGFQVVVTYVQNLLEDNGTVTKFLR